MTEQCRQYCENGIAWAASQAGRKKLKSIANDATFRRKRVNPVYLRQGKGLIVTEGADAKRIRMTREHAAQIRQFPDSIPAVEVYRRLGLDKESRAAQRQVSRGMKSAGFASRRVNGQWVWERAGEK